ncbi:MAG: hypothetical protein FJY99_12810 [Candidatus Sericytochromatia bacterium]|nr:hypothetical protein [Candidatus Tanganyikabacteria bacterium]
MLPKATVQAICHDEAAAAVLVPVLRGLSPDRIRPEIVSLTRWGRRRGIPSGPTPLLRSAFLRSAGPRPDLLLVHADPGHPLPDWAQTQVDRERARGALVLAVQRGCFHPPAHATVDPDRVVEGQVPPPSALPAAHTWDAIAIWGEGFREALPPGSRAVVTGSLALEELLAAVDAEGDGLPALHKELRFKMAQAVNRALGLAPRSPIALLHLGLKPHWWPEARIQTLMVTILTALRDKGLQPVVWPTPGEDATVARLYREAATGIVPTGLPVLKPRVLSSLPLGTWLLGSRMLLTGGHTPGLQAAALGVPALALVPPDAPYTPDFLHTTGHPVLRDPLAYLGESLATQVATLLETPPDPLPFRDFLARMDGGALPRTLAAASFLLEQMTGPRPPA